MSKYQFFPDLTPEEYAALRLSIAQNGVLTPVVVDEDGEVLDGHHRVKVCKEIGVAWPRTVRAGLTTEEKVELGVSLNMDRRHLSVEGRQQVAAKLRKTGYTYGAIGRLLGVGKTTAMRDVRSSESPNGLYPQPEHVDAADGRQRPATYAPRATEPKSEPVDDERRAAALEILKDLPPAELPRELRLFMALAKHYHYVEVDPGLVAEQGAITLGPVDLEGHARTLRAYGEWVLRVADALMAYRPLRRVE